MDSSIAKQEWPAEERIAKLEWPAEERIAKQEWPTEDVAVVDDDRGDLYRSKSQPRVRFADDAARGHYGRGQHSRGQYTRGRGRGRGQYSRGRGGMQTGRGDANSVCRGDNGCGVPSCPNKHYGVRNERGELADCSRLPYCDRKMC